MPLVFAGAATLAISELCTAGACACRTHDPLALPRLVFVQRRDDFTRFRCVGAAVQRGACSVHSCVARARLRWRWQLLGTTGLVPRARAVYPAAACLHAWSSCLCVIVVCGCSFAVQQGAYSLHSCVTRARLRALAIAGVSTCSAQWLPPVQQHTSSPDAQGNLLPLQQRESELETCKSDVDTHSAEPSNEVHAFQEAWLN